MGIADILPLLFPPFVAAVTQHLNVLVFGVVRIRFVEFHLIGMVSDGGNFIGDSLNIDPVSFVLLITVNNVVQP